MIDRALDCANEVPESQNQRLGAVIVDKRGKVLSTGNNKLKTHPMQAKYAKKAKLQSKIYLHAEMSAICHLPRTSEIPHTIYVARLRKDIGTGNARPCPICMAAIQELGIKRIVYTMGHHKFKIEDL